MKNGIKWFREKYQSDKFFFIECMALGFIALLMFVTMFYGDNFAIFLSAFWCDVNALRGELAWLVSSVNTPYGMGHQLICELWALPIVVLYKIFGDAVINSVGAILWYKLIAPFFLVCSMKKMYDIAELFKVEKRKHMLLLACSTILVALPVVHIAQTDVIYLFFMLYGVEAYIKDDYKIFIISYMIAFPMKYIPLIVLIPLILIKEKRILCIIRDVICSVILLPFEKIIRHFANIVVIEKYYKGAEQVSIEVVEAAENNAQVIDPVASHFAHKILYFEFEGVRKGLTVYTLVFIFALICIWCYMQKKDDEGRWKEKAIYVVFVSLLTFFLLSSPSPYWIIILYPFMVLIIFSKKDRFRLNMLLQTVFTLGMFVIFVMDTFWVFGGSCTFNWLVFERMRLVPFVSDLQEGLNIAGYLNKLGINSMMPMITALVLACAIGLSVINYPKVKYKDDITEGDEMRLMHGFIVFQIMLLYIWYVGNILLVGRLFVG